MEKIKQIILSGLLKDVLISEKSFSLNKEINETYAAIPKGIKASISDILYDLSYTEMVLSLSRLYDNTSKKYPTRCLKQLYSYVKSENYNIDISEFREDALFQLPSFGFNASFIEMFKDSSTTEFNKRTVLYFESLEMNEPLCSYINKLKEIRDKFLAHNEDIQIDTLLPYDNIKHLIKHAQDVIAFFAITYCGIHLKSSEGFYLSHSAKKWQRTYNRFINDEE